jgi:hypothetical protein
MGLNPTDLKHGFKQSIAGKALADNALNQGYDGKPCNPEPRTVNLEPLTLNPYPRKEKLN